MLQIDTVNLNNVLLSCSTKSRTLDYTVDDSSSVVPNDFDSVDIVASDLDVKICLHANDADWDGLLVLFLNRVAQLGHFKKLGFSLMSWEVDGMEFEFERLVPVVNALARAIRESEIDVFEYER